MTPNKLLYKFLALGLIVVYGMSCQQQDPPKQVIKESQLKESMANANKMLVSLENEKIKAFIDRYGWKMQKTGTGLQYYIYKSSKGIMPVKGDSVVINYSVMLLNGDQLYSSKTEGPLIFETGKGKTINGLEEGIFLMHMGESAKFIVPSHLAFGLLGDQRKIPQRATLVYDVELTSVKKRQ